MGNQSRLCSGPVTRRTALQFGAATIGGLSMGDIFRLRAQAAVPNADPDTAVLLVWLPGGPPHMETYDMKPEAPLDYRGDFKPIQTVVPGLDVCELLPEHAKVADKFSLIRSIAHKFSDHGGGHKRVMTGRIPKTPVGTVNDAPAVSSIVGKCREHLDRGLPNTIYAADKGREGIDVFAFGSAYLGPSYNPFAIGGDPSDPNFSIPNVSVSEKLEGRLDDRSSLLKSLDRLRRDVDASGAMDAMDLYNRKAISLLTSDKARDAFDLSKEDPAVREMYGMHRYGQRSLLGMRLVEAGASFVTVVLENPTPFNKQMPNDVTYNWDSHAVNCHIFNDSRYRLPMYDQAIAALVTDLYRRGLEKKVLLVVTGEFGRTPKISNQVGTKTGVMQPGRDHWPKAMSVLVSGGGMRGGQIIGSTNSKGEVPKDQPLTPNDLWATVYRHLGIDYQQAFTDFTGRPMPILPFGEPIKGLS